MTDGRIGLLLWLFSRAEQNRSLPGAKLKQRRGGKGFPCLALLCLLIKEVFPRSAPLHLLLRGRCFAILVATINTCYIYSYLTEMAHPPKRDMS